MATRARIAQSIPELIDKLDDMRAIFERIKDAQDQIVLLDNNKAMPITVTNPMRASWRAAFDTKVAEITAEVEAWKA